MAKGNQVAWQKLLDEALEGTGGIEVFSERTGIRASTVYRWRNGDSTPRPSNIQTMLRELPAYRERFESAFMEAGLLPAQQQSSKRQQTEIPVAFYQRALDALTSTPESLLQWTVVQLVLCQARQHLDPHRTGLCIAVAQCMPPNEGKVHSLRETSKISESGEIELGSALFLGAESLAGQCVKEFRAVSVQEFPFLPSEKSILAVPLLRHGKIGGSLYFISHRKDFFSSHQERKLAEQYAALLSLGLTEFYDHDHIDLAVLPSQQEQQHILASRPMPATNMGNAGSWQALEQQLLSASLSQEP